MTKHFTSEDQITAIVAGFENCTTAKDEFPHAHHLAVAVWYLENSTPEKTFQKMREALKRFLAYHKIDPAKYKEELTRAWINLVSEELANIDNEASLLEKANAIVERLADKNAIFERYATNTLLQSEQNKSD